MQSAPALSPSAAKAADLSPSHSWNRAFYLLLVAFAFLLALTTARNSDIWWRLSSGRSLLSASGFTSAWSHTVSWLADLSFYLVYSALGATGLILAKSVLFAATVGLMMQRDDSWQKMPCLFLAALALGGWLPLSPILFSYFFLAFALRRLQSAREDQRLAGGQLIQRQRWLLLGMVLWANCDPWCLLGLAVIGLYALGQTVIGLAQRKGLARGPWQLAALACAATVLSPLPWHAASVWQSLSEPVTGTDPSLSPFRESLLSSLSHGRVEGLFSVLAFWLLFGVSVASFILAFRSRSEESRSLAWQWSLAWLALFIAAVLSARIVPFFIILSAMTAAMNFRAIAIRDALVSARTSPRIEPLRFSLQLGTFSLLAVVLLGAAWAGFMQSLPYERRNWTVEADPSVVRAAQVVEDWYENQQLPSGQSTIFLSRDARDLFIWFSPRTIGSSIEQVDSIAGVRAAILSPDSATDFSRTHDVLADPHVGCVVVSDPNRVVFATVLQYFTALPEKWKLAHLRGRVAIFVRSSSSLPSVDLPSRAFNIAAADRAQSSDGSAYSVKDGWFDPFIHAIPARSIDRDEAVTYLLHEEATRSARMRAAAQKFLAEQVASLVGDPWPRSGLFSLRTLLLAQALNAATPAGGAQPFPFERIAAFQLLNNPSADHYLAVRAARRGVIASPRDAAAFEALGEAYLHLLTDPLESAWALQFQPLRRLRLVQTAAAFKQALTLDSSRAGSHRGLAAVYLEQHFLDLTLVHMKEVERLSQLATPSPDFSKRLQSLEKTVEEARQKTNANAANLTVLDRARLALRNGLAGEALELLLQSDVAAFGTPGIAMELDLLLQVGRVVEAREWLSPEHRSALGEQAYNWVAIQAAAATGDSDSAAGGIREQIASGPKPSSFISADEFWKAVKLSGREILNRKQSAQRMTVSLGTSLLAQYAMTCGQIQFQFKSKTEAYLLLAILALEQGDIAGCAASLESIRKMWENVSPDGDPLPIPHRSIVQQLASLIRR